MKYYFVDNERHLKSAAKYITSGNHVGMLLSYHYHKKTNIKQFKDYCHSIAGIDIELFIDSGGFSAMTLGVPITVDEYAKYIIKNKGEIKAYANLDVIRNAKATAKNQKIMEEKYGLNPVPVFHVGEPWSYLEEMIDKYDYIALGGIVGLLSRKKKINKWLQRCFSMRKPGTKYHGFGVSSPSYLANYPWHTVDSSSWGAGYRWGRVPVYDYRTNVMESAILGNVKSCSSLAELISCYGYDWKDFAVRERSTREDIIAVATRSYEKMSSVVNIIHENKHRKRICLL